MKKLLTAIIIISLFTLIFAGCSGKDGKYEVYFKDRQENKLNVEKREFKDDDTKALAKNLIAELIKGPQDEKNVALFPKETKLLGLAIKNEVATINMSKEYLEPKGAGALLLRFSLVNTLCNIDGIKGIVIQVEGSPLISETTGKEFGVLSLSDVALDVNEQALREKEKITLYFPMKDGNALKKEIRMVEVQNTLSPEKTVINELMKGTQLDECTNAIPSPTKLLGIETKDNVCFVNFSSDFISRSGTSSLQTSLTLFSVVNSLCEVENVKSVQILVNGETGLEFGNYVLDIPYEANNDITKG